MFTIAPAAALDHLRADRAAAVPQPVDVDVPHGAPLLVGHLERGAVEARAGVVDEHVDRPELVRDPLDHRVDAAGVGHVERHGEHAELARGLCRALVVAGGDRGARARLGQRAGEREAEPAVAARDDRDAAVEPERVEHAHGCTTAFTFAGSSRPARRARSVSSSG